MTVEFMLDFNAEVVSDHECKVISTNPDWDNPYIGFYVLQCEAESIRDIRYEDKLGRIYEGDMSMTCKDGIVVITVWNPVAE